MGELTSLFWHCLRDRPAGLTREAIDEAVVAEGLAGWPPERFWAATPANVAAALAAWAEEDTGAPMARDALAAWAEGGAAVLQWTVRGGTALADEPVPADAVALRPLSPVHGHRADDGAGGLWVRWVRRSRVDPGWRDAVDLPLGEGREACRVATSSGDM